MSAQLEAPPRPFAFRAPVAHAVATARRDAGAPRLLRPRSSTLDRRARRRRVSLWHSWSDPSDGDGALRERRGLDGNQAAGGRCERVAPAAHAQMAQKEALGASGAPEGAAAVFTPLDAVAAGLRQPARVAARTSAGCVRTRGLRERAHPSSCLTFWRTRQSITSIRTDIRYNASCPIKKGASTEAPCDQETS